MSGDVSTDLGLTGEERTVEGEHSCTHTYVNYLNCRFIIQTNSGSGYNMKWKQLRNMKIRTLFRLKNIDDDYTIKIICNN